MQFINHLSRLSSADESCRAGYQYLHAVLFIERILQQEEMSGDIGYPRSAFNRTIPLVVNSGLRQAQGRRRKRSVFLVFRWWFLSTLRLFLYR